MIEEQVDPRARHQGHETLQQLRGREHQMRRPIRPRPLQRHGDPSVVQPLHALLPERRAQQVLAEPLEARPIAGGDVHGSVEVEAGIVRVERNVALDPRRVRVAAHPHRPRPARLPNAARPSTAAWDRPASATDSSASGSVSPSVTGTPASPRRSSRRRTRTTTRRTSSSVGGAAGWKPSVPSG